MVNTKDGDVVTGTEEIKEFANEEEESSEEVADESNDVSWLPRELIH